MKTSKLKECALDYRVVRGFHNFIHKIYFTDGDETIAIRGNDRGNLGPAASNLHLMYGGIARRRVRLPTRNEQA